MPSTQSTPHAQHRVGVWLLSCYGGVRSIAHETTPGPVMRGINPRKQGGFRLAMRMNEWHNALHACAVRNIHLHAACCMLHAACPFMKKRGKGCLCIWPHAGLSCPPVQYKRMHVKWAADGVVYPRLLFVGRVAQRCISTSAERRTMDIRPLQIQSLCTYHS